METEKADGLFIIIIKIKGRNVPCYKCAQCGEVVYSASVMEKIEEILDKVQNIASKIFIMDYTKAA